ncbi:MAG: hypothetical protein JGK38_23845 [Microcoleus sp. PH2017_15_JOR_U_A]|uniref:hypothetical protein n=1 Tax=unclassified Microcoleus TaxID=2642155 RepID=UPI001D21625D|nr:MULTISPECIES: hypothetical protein [unclassified Microcoleus]MCC3473291.1 hypothetical protein [Microcoleus sp. PH2017_13_LAR_U_A]MCC3486542.1 hypothetical protein [Microcoleus sp. PH2017_14_LAR_D_A]MCC3499590.1 hypothetical protein [Microcoleus sp. PH2017_15_JOR_U_A]MCC3623185.1 hypothetical protein [Microcoleus sp. PH2017_36_ELK_O_B]
MIVNKLGYQKCPIFGTFLYELFFSDKAKQLEQELEKQSFCDFSIEENSDYFCPGREQKQLPAPRERNLDWQGLQKKCPKNGTFFEEMWNLRGCAVLLAAEIA